MPSFLFLFLTLLCHSLVLMATETKLPNVDLIWYEKEKTELNIEIRKSKRWIGWAESSGTTKGGVPPRSVVLAKFQLGISQLKKILAEERIRLYDTPNNAPERAERLHNVVRAELNLVELQIKGLTNEITWLNQQIENSKRLSKQGNRFADSMTTFDQNGLWEAEMKRDEMENLKKVIELQLKK